MGRQWQPRGGLGVICGLLASVLASVLGGMRGGNRGVPLCLLLRARLLSGLIRLSLTCLGMIRLARSGLALIRLLAALLPGVALAGLACLGCARLRLARMSVRWLHARPIARGRTRRILRCGKGIVAIGHEQAGEPPALPQRTDRVYERKSHEHSSQATSALLWLGQISSCPVASTTAMELVAVPKPLSVALTRLAASTSAFLP